MSNYYNRQWRLPNAWNGTESNVNKQSNYSLLFDGSSQYIDIDSSSFGSDSFSISLWFKQDTGTGFQGLFAGSGYDGGTGLIIYTYLNTVKIYTAVSGSTTNILTSTTFSFDTWYHVILKREYNVGWSLYIDGTEVNTYSSLTTTDLTSANTRIGKHYTSGLYFNGQIDGVAIFDYALSSSQVTTLYGSSSTGIGNPQSITPNPVAWYNLGDQDAFNGSNYLVPNSSLKDFVFDFVPNDYIQTSGFTIGNNYSFSCWLKSDTTSPSNMCFLSSPNYFTIGYDGNFVIRFTSATQIQMFSYNGRADSESSTVTIPSIDTNWHHFALTSNGTTTNIYWDGSPLTVTGNQTKSLDNILQGLIIGDNITRNNNAFDGQMSNTQIFNTALPATGSNSVETLYNNGSPLTSMSGFTSLQGWWKLDSSATYDGSNWTIPDDSSNSNDGTSSGMTQANLIQSDLSFTSGYSPYALDFDGANDYIDCGNDSSLNISGDLTLSIWVYLESDLTFNMVISKTIDANYRNYNFTIRPTTRTITFYTNNGTYENTTTSLSVDLNTWTNIVISCESGVTNGTKFYFNNVLDTTTGTHTITGETSDLYFGVTKFTGSFANYFDGKLSNASIWNTNLTSAQVSEIYNEGVPSNLNNHSAYSNLVSWWQLGSNSSFNTNWTVLDEKGSNNGTSVNMIESDITDGVGSYANGLSSGMGGDEVIGDAPYSSSNSLSVNMDVEDRTTDTPS